jgi:hypothetical protein
MKNIMIKRRYDLKAMEFILNIQLQEFNEIIKIMQERSI